MTNAEKEMVERLRRRWILPRWALAGMVTNGLLIAATLVYIIFKPGPADTNVNFNTALLLLVVFVKMFVYPRMFHNWRADEARDEATLQLLEIIKNYQQMTVLVNKETRKTVVEAAAQAVLTTADTVAQVRQVIADSLPPPDSVLFKSGSKVEGDDLPTVK